ncbi:hypothetical protein DFJ58DRAFT_771611 [Suillus subalutaceus]|uniref:uncharacterized protein n=1 Tax=Suillus subalutaceus TaxID=48586 RepID=UPI001B8715B0|nr:uncharacterized protein DFJ58DRAFT_771611 [Suillus subalutaceus]KAG1864926.1 hypothetical protein DFJ58DRAFT_771611 [Suillus subalutaceus]
MSRNVVIIGHSGVGKSSLINMLYPKASALTSDDLNGCTTAEETYGPCDIGEQQYCQLHDTVGLEEGFWGFFSALIAKRRLKKYLKTIDPHLLVYCMPGVRSSLKKSHGHNFNRFKSAVGNRVPIVVVVTKLEDSGNPGDWWLANLDMLRKLNIPESTKHACVTTLPEVHLRPGLGLYHTSREAVKALIRNNLR